MADTSVIYLFDPGGSADGTAYPTVQLPANILEHFEDRESFVEIGEGHEPIFARVWMTVDQFEALPAGFKQGTATLGIKMEGQGNDYPATLNTQSIGPQTLQFANAFYLLYARICRAAINVDLYEVKLTTIQNFWKFFPVTGGSGGHLAYNVLSDDKTGYQFGATDSATPKSLQTIVTDLKNDLGIGPGLTIPAGSAGIAFTLNNLFFDKASAGEGLARILKPLGCHLVCDPFTSTTALTWSIAQLDYTDPTDEDGDLGNLASVAIYDGMSTGSGGTQSFNVDGALFPEKVHVRFPIWPTPDKSNPRWTVKTETNPLSGSGGSAAIEGTFDTINAGDRYDVTNSGGLQYTQNLSDIAAARATAYFGRANIPYNCQIFSGGYPILPGNTIRRVRISMDNDGWFTTVWRHGLWDHPREDGAWDSYTHQWATEHRAPQFPELGEQDDAGFYPRDDGTFDPWGKPQEIFGKVGSSPLQDGSNFRWKYPWNQVVKSGSAGYGGWQTLTGGITGTTSSKPLYNMVEDMNSSGSAGHPFGNGVDSANLKGTFAVQPIPAGVIVRVYQVAGSAGSGGPNIEFWCEYANGIDGQCSA